MLSRLLPRPHIRRSSTVCVSGLALGLVLGFTPTVWGWDTPEHIEFGNQIADPFEDRLGEDVPVIACTGAASICELPAGPSTFGDWVSAPDFGRSLNRFLFLRASSGPVACARMWSREQSHVDGEPLDDQTLAEGASGTSWADKAGIIDCADGWTFNNNHFGDFAANQYVYYHQQALEAARRYRRHRNPACREAAYTLEGWGQHYLTDSTAAGHAWNPPGNYDADGVLNWLTGLGLNVATGPGIRLRIHNYFNKNGARMSAGALVRDEDGVLELQEFFLDNETWWGDHAEKHTANGLPISAQDGSRQKEITMRLARIGLGQVIAAAECGGDGMRSVFHSPNERTDPRRVYVSNVSMCKAMFGREIWGASGLLSFVPNGVKMAGLDAPELRELFEQCARDGGNLTQDRDGIWLASNYFSDKFSKPGEGASISILRDPKSIISLEELGCFDADDTAPVAADATDLCGNTLCAVPALSGTCPSGMENVGGCCWNKSDSFGSGPVEATPFVMVDGAFVDLPATGAVPGDAAEFFWFEPKPDATAPAADFSRVADSGTQRLVGRGEVVEECGALGSFSVFEARVRGDVGDEVLTLHIVDLDEGVKVQVNGHVVAHIDRHSNSDINGRYQMVSLPLATDSVPVAADGSRVIRLTHINSCGPETPLQVALSVEERSGNLCERCDGDGGPRDSAGGCAVGGGSAPVLILLVAAAAATLSRRRRSPRPA